MYVMILMNNIYTVIRRVIIDDNNFFTIGESCCHNGISQFAYCTFFVEIGYGDWNFLNVHIHPDVLLSVWRKLFNRAGYLICFILSGMEFL